MLPLEHFIYHDWGKEDIKKPSRCGKKNAKFSRTYNNNNIFTFDTETTSIMYKDKKCSFVYISMICINGKVYFTRDLNVFKQFLDLYDTPNTINVIYVHNLSFDFAFVQNVIPFEKVFARRPHRPMFARYKSWEFRCSYFLSHMSLQNVGKSYNLPHAKLVDGLDYRKIRHTSTPLTELEEDYAELDVLVLHEYVQYMLKNNDGKYKEIPYTQTGFVRKYLLENAKKERSYYELRRIVKNTKPSLHVFEMLENAYSGGYTHANYIATGTGLYRNVKSYDYTSSYPAVMVRCKYPMTEFKKVTSNFKRYVESDDYACVGLFKITDVQAKGALCYISKHKCKKIVNGVINNGRVFSADMIEIYLTDVDIKTIKMMYNCKINVIEMYISKSGYLPRNIVQSILQLYKNKTQFKGIPEKFSLYMSSKEMLNSIYGCSVFNPYCDEIVYENGEWLIEFATPEKLDKYYENRKTILPYQWGVFVTAWARFNLCNIASKIDSNDVLYMDTDSIKFIGEYDHLFKEDNQKIHDENIRISKLQNIDFSYFAPSDIKGNTHEIGLWDFEHEYKSFKCLGAKRYCYTLKGDPDIYPVVAGCPTQKMKEWLKLHDCNALLEPFRLDIFLDRKECGKNTITYHGDLNIDIPVTDYLGNTDMVHIGYGAYVEPTTFDMSFSEDYLKFLLGYAVADRGQLVRNGVVIQT